MQVIGLPDSGAERVVPGLLTNGLRAIRTAWRRVTIRSLTPLVFLWSAT